MKKTWLKAVSIFLCLLLVFSFSVTALAVTAEGSGEYADPYLISTKEDLEAISKAVSDGEDFDGVFFRLENDITVTDSFAPIGTKETPFSGYFDGNGKTVSGLSLDRDYAGLFAFTDKAVIKGLTVNGALKADSFAGAITAYAKNTVIEDCKASVSVTAESYAGGIAGYIESGSIKNCSTTGSTIIAGHKEYTGGIAGFTKATITSCENNAYILGSDTAGGIAGASEGDILLCTNKVNLEASENLGGIAGLCEGEIKYCTNTGDLKADTNLGGIAGVGYNAKITQCSSSGKLTANISFAGGVAGYLSGAEVSNCISTGNVFASTFAGGIFGNAQKSVISECIALSGVTALDSSYAGIGALSNSTVTKCYYNSGANSSALYTGTSSETAGIPASAFTSKESFTSLDFENIWEINLLHASHPLLKNIPYHTVSATSTEKAECEKDGKVQGICNICNQQVTILTPAFGHSYIVVSSKLPSCKIAGYTDRLCTTCGKAESETVPATGHTDEDGNKICDICAQDLKEEAPTQTEKSFFEKLADFFRMLIEWIANIFNG